MKSKMLRNAINVCTLGVLTLVAATPALSDDSSGFYVGGSVGQSQADIAKREIVDDLEQAGFTTTRFRQDETDFGFKLLGGYQFNEYFSVEGGYFDLGEFSFEATTVPAGSKAGELGFAGWNLDVVGMFPVLERLDVFARFGAHRGKATVVYTDGGAVTSSERRVSKTDVDYKYGVGLQYGLTDAWALRLEAERYRMDDAVGNKGDLDLVSAGIIYKFSREPRQTREEVARADAADLIIVPLPGPTEEYCTLLDIQFEIAQHEIQLEEWERLAEVARFLKRYPKTSAVIEGHSDSVGLAEQNRQLSQDRAQSVVDYFVKEHQISRSRLTAVGYGESRPLESNRTEEGKRANRRIAAIIGCATDIAGLKAIPARMTLALHIEFDTDGVKIRPEYHDELRKVAGFLKENPTIKATMEGHADNASPQTAQRISQQRAQSVATYLEEKLGVDGARLTVRGYGATRRFAYNTSAEGRQENRRVNIILDYQD